MIIGTGCLLLHLVLLIVLVILVENRDLGWTTIVNDLIIGLT